MSGFVQKGANNSAVTGSNQPTISGVTAGNTLICCFAASNNTVTLSAPTDSAGQTWTIASTITNGTTPSQVCVAFLLNANSGTHTLTWTSLGGQTSNAQISEFNGITAFDVASAGITGSAATATAPTISQAQANEILIALCETTGAVNPEFNTSNSTPPTGWTGEVALQNDASGSFVADEGAYFVATTTASKTATWNWTTSGAFSAALVGFKYTPAAANPFEAQPLSTLSSHPVRDLGTVLVPNNLAIFTDRPIPLMGQCWT